LHDVVGWLIQIGLILQKVVALEGFEDKWHHDHKGGLSESLADAHSLTSQEWEKTEWAPVAISFLKPLWDVFVVILALLVLIMMKLLNIDHHNLALLNWDANYFYILGHAK
jgi:hypothetical protein